MCQPVSDSSLVVVLSRHSVLHSCLVYHIHTVVPLPSITFVPLFVTSYGAMAKWFWRVLYLFLCSCLWGAYHSDNTVACVANALFLLYCLACSSLYCLIVVWRRKGNPLMNRKLLIDDLVKLCHTERRRVFTSRCRICPGFAGCICDLVSFVNLCLFVAS